MLLQEMNYQEKIAVLDPWFEEILVDVKKDLKNEHLKIDRGFYKKYFLSKPLNAISLPEMTLAYRKDLQEGNVGLAEFIATRWILKHTDIYAYFEEQLRTITPDFENLKELPESAAITLMQAAVTHFGAKKTYIFSLFNSVVFPPHCYEQLKHKAEQEAHRQHEEQTAQQTATSLDALQQKFTREIAALKDRYEKKLIGMQRKYLQDTHALKKQIGLLQKKLYPSS